MPPDANMAAPAQSGVSSTRLLFYGGLIGALAPFFAFALGVITLALSGTPDERGFWPVLVLAIAVGLVLARNRTAYSETVIKGMAQPIVMLMVTAWLLASVIGVLMEKTGFVEALTWSAGRLGLGGHSFIVASFLICCVVSTSTGTSIGSLLVCGPLLYPAGGMLGSSLPLLAGAILGGATFGDSISPISDTSISSALTQEADIGGTVRSRLKYVLIAGAFAMIGFYLYSVFATTATGRHTALTGRPDGLPMLAVPILIIAMLVAGRHLLHGLMTGLVVGVLIGLSFGILPVESLISLDKQNFVARSFVIEGFNRGLGISIFTMLLCGIVAGLEASGVLQRLVEFARRRINSVRSCEAWIVGVVTGAVLLTCHSNVAILTVGHFARDLGSQFGLHRYRRANLLDLPVSTVPFLLPYFIPVIVAASTTRSGAAFGLPAVAPGALGLHNFYSWGLLVMVIIAVTTGFGRRFASDAAVSPEILASSKPKKTEEPTFTQSR